MPKSWITGPKVNLLFPNSVTGLVYHFILLQQCMRLFLHSLHNKIFSSFLYHRVILLHIYKWEKASFCMFMSHFHLFSVNCLFYSHFFLSLVIRSCYFLVLECFHFLHLDLVHFEMADSRAGKVSDKSKKSHGASKEGRNKWWRHVKKTQKPKCRGSCWPILGQFEQL